MNHLGRKYDVVGVFNFGTEKADQVYLNWKELGLPEEKPVHVFDFWNKEYLGAWSGGMAVPTTPTSCRVLTLLPETGKIQLISSSRHITQGPVDLVALEQADDIFKGKSHLIKNDPYQLSFVFPRGTNHIVIRAVARVGNENLPVKISNHQGWASVEIISSKTEDVTWEVEFGPGKLYHFPPSAPERLVVQSVGLAGVNLSWQEQYYLNAGYLVYLDGKLMGYTPEARFTIHGLDAQSNHSAQVKSVWEDGKESAKDAAIKFTLATLTPGSLSLTELEPVRATGLWAGYEIDELLNAAGLAVAGNHYGRGLSAFADSETEFDLRGLYKIFTAKTGVDDRSHENVAADFVVLGDGKELWRSGALKKGDPPKTVEINISGVHRLVLRANVSGTAHGRIQTDWLDPQVTK